jgi:hypothetical protein
LIAWRGRVKSQSVKSTEAVALDCIRNLCFDDHKIKSAINSGTGLYFGAVSVISKYKLQEAMLLD